MLSTFEQLGGVPVILCGASPVNKVAGLGRDTTQCPFPRAGAHSGPPNRGSAIAERERLEHLVTPAEITAGYYRTH